MKKPPTIKTPEQLFEAIPCRNHEDDHADLSQETLRLVRAKRALCAGYSDEVSGDEIITKIVDCLADIRHLCDHLDIDFDIAEADAWNHYDEEKKQEAEQ